MSKKEVKNPEKKSLKEAPPKIPQKKPEKAPRTEVEAKKPQTKWWKLVCYTLMIAGWVFVAVVGPQFLISILAYRLLPLEWVGSPVGNATLSTVMYLVSIFLVLWVPSKITNLKLVRQTRERLGLNGLPTWTDIGLTTVGYVAMTLIGMGITAVFQNFDWFMVNEAQELGYSFYMPNWQKALAFIEVVVIAPVMEEVIFRGWLYGNLRLRIPKWIAVLVVSLLFGLVHMQWNVGISVFALSVVNCVFREITGTIYAGTLVHILNNAIAFYLLYIAGAGV